MKKLRESRKLFLVEQDSRKLIGCPICVIINCIKDKSLFETSRKKKKMLQFLSTRITREQERIITTEFRNLSFCSKDHRVIASAIKKNSQILASSPITALAVTKFDAEFQKRYIAFLLASAEHQKIWQEYRDACSKFGLEASETLALRSQAAHNTVVMRRRARSLRDIKIDIANFCKSAQVGGTSL